MGYEVELQAVPPPSEDGPLALAADGRIDPDLLSLTPWLLKDLAEGRTVASLDLDAGSIPLAESLAGVLKRRPGLERRRCDLDRRFDWLRWTLGHARPHGDRDLARIAVGGHRPLDPPAEGTQGFPTRWSPPAVCDSGLRWLSRITEEQLDSGFDPDRMLKAHLYKWPQQMGDPDGALRAIRHDFAALRAFYEQVVAHGEAVLFLKD